jgi:hypothetical protein
MFCPQFYEELVICGTDGRLVASESFDFQRDVSSKSQIAIEFGELGASRITDVAYTTPVEQSGHNGATFFEHVAIADQLDGKNTDAATPLDGLWSMVTAAAAQASVDSGEVVVVDELIESNGLRDLLGR